jgi:hypothetical protein
MTPRQIWTGTGVIGGLLALLLLAQAPAPGLERAPTPPAKPPGLPQLDSLDRREQDQEAATLLATSSLWGPRPTAPAAPASAAELPPPRWFISGVYQVGSERRAVLHFEDNRAPAQQLRVGDNLPDGRRLVAVDRDGVTLRHTASSQRAARKLALEQAREQAQAAGKPLARPAPVAVEERLPVPRRQG